MFQDEARFGRINDVRRCWAPRPMRPLCQAMLTHEYTYAYASCEPATGTMDALILPQVNTQCMQIFLDTVSARHADDHIVMVMDAAGWHSSKNLVAPSNIRLLALPPYAPELNPVEHLWDDRKRAANPPCPLPYSCGLQSGGCGWRCPTMGQQLADSAIALRRQAGQHIFQIGIRIMPIELGTLDQTHDGRTALARTQ
jgi:transposase